MTLELTQAAVLKNAVVSAKASINTLTEIGVVLDPAAEMRIFRVLICVQLSVAIQVAQWNANGRAAIAQITDKQISDFLEDMR